MRMKEMTADLKHSWLLNKFTSGYEGLGETLHLTDENKDGGREWFCGGKSNCENISQNVFIGTLFISAFQAQDEQVEDRTVR